MPPRKPKPKKGSLPVKKAPSIESTRRRSARGQAGAPAKKSPYFEHPSDDDEEEDGNRNEEEEEEEEKEEEEEYRSESGPVSEYESDVSLSKMGNETLGKESVKPRKRGRSSTNTTTPSSGTKKSKKSGEVFIPIRQPSPGGIEYQAYKIHPNTLDFLKALAKNNDRTWFSEHDGLYKNAKSDFESFVGSISKAVIENVDDTIPELPLKDLIFRIYRDIRFSNDRTPYKTHFSAAWSRTGKKGPYACYFLSLQPGNSFIGGGLWHTDAQPLNLLRRNVDTSPHQIKSILIGERLAKEFFSAEASGNERKAVKAFVERNKEDALKTAPKNYPKDHKDIELLRLRSYTLGKRLTDEEVTGDDAVQRIASIFEKMEPFISYLNNVVMPEINAESSNGEDAVSGGGDSDGSNM